MKNIKFNINDRVVYVCDRTGMGASFPLNSKGTVAGLSTNTFGSTLVDVKLDKFDGVHGFYPLELKLCD